ncbi:MAG TPA: ribulose-phosphate 3-epimerase [Candidatus Onthoplasma faecipullorum]|nr:ribulose-phosphate 3-epimerase [Candidatus Onthoplasma faecipullorum]
MKKIVVSASSLPAGRNMSSQIEYIQRVGNFGADMYHLDVMDGKFVKNKSIDQTYVEQLREKSALLFDVHLMIENADKVVKKYINAGANIISVQFEAFSDEKVLIKTLKTIKNSGVMAGIAIDIDTDVNKIEPIIKYVDMVLVLCVKVGKGGQDFNKNAIKKIKTLRSQYPDLLIEADGGINDKSAPSVVRAGADILVSGHYIYTNDAYEAIQTLKGKNGQ